MYGHEEYHPVMKRLTIVSAIGGFILIFFHHIDIWVAIIGVGILLLSLCMLYITGGYKKWSQQPFVVKMLAYLSMGLGAYVMLALFIATLGMIQGFQDQS